MILRIIANSAWICVPDADVGRDGLPVLSEISLETARGIRVSSSATRRAAPRRKLDRVRAPASLDEIPRLDPAALGKYNVLQAIYSVLRSNAKQEKPTDCRDLPSDIAWFRMPSGPRRRRRPRYSLRLQMLSYCESKKCAQFMISFEALV